MAFKWGNTDLYIVPDTYTPPWGESPIVEIALAPDPENLTAACTVIQQQGKKRDNMTLATYVKDYSIYQAMLADQVAGTVRTFAGPDATMTAVISTITPATRKIYPTRWEFTITLMEATP